MRLPPQTGPIDRSRRSWTTAYAARAGGLFGAVRPSLDPILCTCTTGGCTGIVECQNHSGCSCTGSPLTCTCNEAEPEKN